MARRIKEKYTDAEIARITRESTMLTKDISILLDYIKRHINEMSFCELRNNMLQMDGMVAEQMYYYNATCDDALSWLRCWRNKCEEAILDSRVALV